MLREWPGGQWVRRGVGEVRQKKPDRVLETIVMTLAFPLSEMGVGVGLGGGNKGTRKEFDSGYVLKVTDVPVDGGLDIREGKLSKPMVFGWST